MGAALATNGATFDLSSVFSDFNVSIASAGASSVASFLVAIPTVFYLAKGETVRTMPLFMYVIMALIGVLFTLIGTYVGERVQMGPPPKVAE